jgi:hypothetical protein
VQLQLQWGRRYPFFIWVSLDNSEDCFYFLRT